MSIGKDKLIELAMSRVNNDKVEESLGQVMVGVLATDSATNIADASARVSLNQVNTLTSLKDLGYDKDSQVAQSVNDSSTEIQKVLVKLANAAAKHV